MASLDFETLDVVARLDAKKILNPAAQELGRVTASEPVLVMLAAGMGARFGPQPKCIQPVAGLPLARHSLNAFRELSPAPAVCLVGYCHEEVAQALGYDNILVRSDNPTGGTAYAAFEAFSVAELERINPVLVVTMGDRLVPAAIFRALLETHRAGGSEAALTMLTAIYDPPRNQGKGRIVRDDQGRILQIIEQRDIDQLADVNTRERLQQQTEGNCPLYAIRAATLRRYLARLDRRNAQKQFYFTDIIAAIQLDGDEIRTLTVHPSDRAYELLCADVTRPSDLERLEEVLTGSGEATEVPQNVEDLGREITAERSYEQSVSIAAQLEELYKSSRETGFTWETNQPLGIGISGGRLRIAFMHPDMGRFFGPAWQMPIGAGRVDGREQVVVLLQDAAEPYLQMHISEPLFREKINQVAADEDWMYPGEDVSDAYAYEDFGTRMATRVLLSLGYFSDEELSRRREQKLPLPPPALWASNNLRRPFSLLANALASIRTLREGNLGGKVQAVLGRERFRGLRVMSTGLIPQGGFSSSSAVTVAVKNGLNALFDLGMSTSKMVELACQAEYGTGVRAGALDQATEQIGRHAHGTLISSNPRDHYRILGTYPVPTGRFRMLFPYSVERDREAWRWSAGYYAKVSGEPQLTAAEMRKMTGKAAEIAALLVKLPLDQDFFPRIQSDLIETGRLSVANQRWVHEVLLQLPLGIDVEDLKVRIWERRDWLVDQYCEHRGSAREAARQLAQNTIESLFAGWRNPRLKRTRPDGQIVEEMGVPLRAMVAYLFAEVTKNCYLIHHTDEWIRCVTSSQRGDCCVTIDPQRLPSKEALLRGAQWEKGIDGPALLDQWLERCGAVPHDFNRGLSDEELTAQDLPSWHGAVGTSFFRGLPLIDFAEAMLKRAFGDDAIAVRVNAAGQGDFFQVHVDTQQADPEEVKEFIRQAFYRRFGLKPKQEFVEPYPGGGAVGIRLPRFADLPELIRTIRAQAILFKSTESGSRTEAGAAVT